MFVGEDQSPMGQEYGVDDLTYCMELDFSERTLIRRWKSYQAERKVMVLWIFPLCPASIVTI